MPDLPPSLPSPSPSPLRTLRRDESSIYESRPVTSAATTGQQETERCFVLGLCRIRRRRWKRNSQRNDERVKATQIVETSPHKQAEATDARGLQRARGSTEGERDPFPSLKRFTGREKDSFRFLRFTSSEITRTFLVVRLFRPR